MDRQVLLPWRFEAKGQLQFLPLGQDEEVPEDQDRDHHGPGAVKQDEGAEGLGAEGVQIG
jgi:hypothetical protein